MIFYILFWLVVAIVGFVLLAFWVEYVKSNRGAYKWGYGISVWWPIGAMFWVPAIGAIILVVLGLIIGGIAGIGVDYHQVRDEKVKLKALGTGDSVEGYAYSSLFLTVGYVDGKRVVSYVQEREDGGFQIGQVNGSDAVIYEKPDETSMTIHYWEKTNEFWIPGVLGTAKTYTFVVPEGSVANSFEVTP